MTLEDYNKQELIDYCNRHGCNYCWFSQSYNPVAYGGHASYEDKAKKYLNQKYGRESIERCRFEIHG